MPLPNVAGPEPTKTADKPRRHRYIEVRFDDELLEGPLRDSLGRHLPLLALREALAFDATFLQRVDAVRSASDESARERLIDAAARPYAWNGGRPLRVMREVVVRSAAGSSRFPSAAVLNFPPVPGGAVEAGGASDMRWRKAGQYRAAADKLVRLGAGLCVVAGCVTRTNRGEPSKAGRRYCSAHAGRASLEQRADTDAIAGLLHAVGDLLRID